jgi:membrane dipeptidase
VLVVRTADDIRLAKHSGRIGLILGSEGAKHLEGSQAALRNFFRLGVRQVQLHWAIRNQLGTAQSDLDEPGLTEFGGGVIAEMNRLGMLIDVSHS